MRKFEVEFYEKEDGSKPVNEILALLDSKMHARIVGLIGVLQEKGNSLREPYSKPLGDGIFELRAQVGTDISRVLYFFYYGGKIVMTHGFVKKTQKTPPREIWRAKKYRKDFIERYENG